jgi:hypothetical protein
MMVRSVPDVEAVASLGEIRELTFPPLIAAGGAKAAHFPSARAGLEAAERCDGPWFNVPDPTTVEAIESRHLGHGQANPE